MDRAIRKANLKKLQLPSTAVGRQKRKSQQSSNSINADTAITNYFATPEKHGQAEVTANGARNLSPIASKRNTNDEDASQLPDNYLNTIPHKRAKRTKLDAFIFKDPNAIPDKTKNVRNSLNNDDFIVTEKKVKMAPKSVTTGNKTKNTKFLRRKRQTTIKSAFFRNEQMFAEIAAQHCAAEQFDGDDVQLALAISQSEAECKVGTVNQNVMDGDANIVDAVKQAESIREKLKKYGFRTAEKKDYNVFAATFRPKIGSSRQKLKWANKFTALTLRSSETQLNKLLGNIEKLLNSQFRTKPLNEHEMVLPDYELQSPLLKKSAVRENRQVLQNAENEDYPNELYFVRDLFEINDLPAGYLLKDWTAIQGRDLTPNPKSKQSARRLKTLENIYRDLEEFFSSRRILDWTINSGEGKSPKVLINSEEIKKEDCSPAIVKRKSKLFENMENVELDQIKDFKKDTQMPQKTYIENTETKLSDSVREKKILRLLPTAKSLDMMHVSSCNVSSQTTVNTTHTVRSNSPDLFADSDIETEESDRNEGDIKAEVKTVINVAKDSKSTSSFNDAGVDITTYELFSSDEVKNTLLLEQNKSNAKEPSPEKSLHTSHEEIIDLTQNVFELTANNKSNNSNQSKQIVEVDLFADSPLQDENDDPGDMKSTTPISQCIQENEKETCRLSLNSATINNEQQIREKKMEQTFKLSPCIGSQGQSKEPNTYNVDDIVLRELDINQSNTTFSHEKTVTAHDTIKDDLLGDDSVFQELCKKYLHKERVDAKKTDFEESFPQILPPIRVQTPEKYNFANFTMDFEGKDTLKRRSLSFTAKTPIKMGTNDNDRILSKSQSFNNNNSNASIDLTQNDGEYDEDDDDCLVLSDDEINYSIWKANKAEYIQTTQQSDHDDIVSVSDNEAVSDEDDHIIEFPYERDNKEFSSLDLNDKKNSLIKLDLEVEKSLSDFEILTSKYASHNSPDEIVSKFDRSDFGILEEYSESTDYIPNTGTPTDVLTGASFLSSPTETTAPMKLYSNCHRSSQKFQELINNIEKKSPQTVISNFDDFDEFDNLIYTSPLKSGKSNKKPEGFDQLLTAEISYSGSQEAPKASTNISSNSPLSSTQEIKCNNKIYTVRYTCSPKPDYTKYTEAELLKELYNFGIKPLKRKQAVKMLEYIYNQTHPLLMDNEEHVGGTREEHVIELSDCERPCTSKKAIRNNALISKPCNDVLHESKGYKKKLYLQDSCGLEMLRYSIDLKAELSDENYILQTNVNKKTPRPLLPFHIAWYNLVCSNQKLHENILMYEPIDLQEIYLFLKTLGYRYDPKDLKLFFDRRCIIFRYDLTSAVGDNQKTKDTNRHVRKSKKTKI